MRRIDENRAENFIKKHERYKKWLAFALCITLLTGTGTLYLMNKPATAMTEEGAQQIGLVLETADAEYEQGLIEQMESDEASAEAASVDEDADEASVDAALGEASVEAADEADSSASLGSSLTEGEELAAAADSASSLGSSLIEEELAAAASSASSLGSSLTEETTLSENVVLTVAYVDQNGEKLADEREINLSDSINFVEEAREIEGYVFDSAAINGEEITTITALLDENEFKYYEAVLANGDVVEIKENMAVVLTYAKISEELEASVVLTAKYVDKDGEVIRDSEELTVTDKTEFNREKAPEIFGYTFEKATIDDEAVTGIASVQPESTSESVKAAGHYEAILVDGSKVEITEDKTVVLTYVKSNTKAAVSVALKGRYVDKSGEKIADEQDLKITAETLASKLEPEEIDGYFYQGLFYEEKEIVKITPETEEDTDKKTDETGTASVSAGADEAVEEVVITGYKLETAEGETVEITEDAEISFIFVKASKEKEFTFTDQKVNIKVVTNKTNVFPEGVELKATEVTKETENYNYTAYMDALNENAEAIANEAGKETTDKLTENNTLLYDIAFIYEGIEIQPKDGSVTVTIEFKDQQLSEGLTASSNEDVAVVHLPIKEEVKESAEITTTEEATDITKEDIKVETLTEASVQVGDEQKVEFTSDSFSIFAVITYQEHEAGTDTFESVLGDAVNFGIVTNEVIVNESQTNIAAKRLIAGGQTGCDLTNNVEQTFLAGSLEGSFNVKGHRAYFIIPSEYTEYINEGKSENVRFDTSYTSSELEKIVGDMLQYTRDASADLASESRKSIRKPLVTDPTDSSKSIIDIRSWESGTYYFILDADDMKTIEGAEKLRIFKNSDQRIVFNVTAEGTVNLYKYGVSNDGGSLVYTDSLLSATGDRTTRSIIWNFINATQVNSLGSVAGVFISGRTDATWYNQSTCAGWLAFPKVILYAQEWHNTYDEMKQISGTAQFQAYKNIDNQEATVSGFKFTLYKKDDSSAGGWTEIETVKNDNDAPHNISFSSITYGADSSKQGQKGYQYTTAGNSGDTEDFIYKIVETDGTTDVEGNAYNPDITVYYAKVTVTCQTINKHTNNTYYRVSAPEYFTDEACTVKVDDIPVFNNTTTKERVGLFLYKYVNGSDVVNEKFRFTVKVLKPDAGTNDNARTGRLVTLTENELLENDGNTISFDYEYTNDYLFKGSLFFVITEDDVTNSDYTKDKDVIVVRVADAGTDKQKIYYMRFDYDNPDSTADKDLIDGIETAPYKATYVWQLTKKEGHLITDPSDVAFYNKGNGMLRIHKMVVNDYGKNTVRDGDNPILSNVKFRITNNITKDYIILKGETGDVKTAHTAIEYNSSNSPTGATYSYYYNRNAQWTIVGIPAGDYSVEEVADGWTFSYDDKNNVSYPIDSHLSRVTMYDVTEDDENTGLRNNPYGIGGNNYRKVFSADVANSPIPPEHVVVGGAIKTVQVCNYYSTPIGPIQISKKFEGGVWDENMQFQFKIEPIGFNARVSEGHVVDTNDQPMPYDVATGQRQDTITLTGADLNTYEDGTYAVGKFASIPFRYEGVYNYKITEIDTGLDGVIYDTSEYYVRIEVSKKYTIFRKQYTSGEDGNQCNPLPKYANVALLDIDEDFWYLGADVTYATDANFNNIVATCELYFEEYLDTSVRFNNEFNVNYTSGNIKDVSFTNTITGQLTVRKEWKNTAGNDDSANHTKPLVLQIWQKTENGNSWKVYKVDGKEKTINLTAENGWTETVKELPLKNENGEKYVYTVKEADENTKTYSVSYTYGQTYFASQQSRIRVEGIDVEVLDTGYVMKPDDNYNYGEVVITNRNVVVNELPETGGMGADKVAAIGAMLIVLALAGYMLFKKKEVL